VVRGGSNFQNHEAEQREEIGWLESREAAQEIRAERNTLGTLLVLKSEWQRENKPTDDEEQEHAFARVTLGRGGGSVEGSSRRAVPAANQKER